jgi:hypothetical protein
MPQETDDLAKASPPKFFRVREDILGEIVEGLDKIAIPLVQFHENDVAFLKNIIAQGRGEAERLKKLITEDRLSFAFRKEMTSDERDDQT